MNKFNFNILIALVLLSAILLSNATQATIMVYPFDDQIQEQRFNKLVKELRCPKCQNNNLADSNSALAIDLKDIIYEQIKAGKTDDEIIFYLKQRYGDFISYRPPLKPSTWIIWFGPFVALLFGGLFVFRFVSNAKERQTHPVDISADELLDEWKNEDLSELENKEKGDKQ